MADTNRNASSVLFGFQYQINVAIYFMFEYLNRLKDIKLEGKKEDIELSLIKNEKFMIQVKSQTKDLNDETNNIRKLKDSLISLAEADNKNVKYLIYVSNMVNPLKKPFSDFSNEKIILKKYSELSEEAQSVVDLQIERNVDKKDNQIYNLNKDKLLIVKLPFFGEVLRQKRSFILDVVSEKLSSFSENLVNKKNDIIDYWESKFLQNGSENPKMKITKKEICSVLILFEIENINMDTILSELSIDEIYYDATYNKYKKIIDEKSNCYEYISKVYSLYKKIKSKQPITISEFVTSHKLILYNIFYDNVIDLESRMSNKEKVDMFVSQIISYTILRKQLIIEDIMRKV